MVRIELTKFRYKYADDDSTIFQVVIKVYSINSSQTGQLRMPQNVFLSCTIQHRRQLTPTCLHLNSEFFITTPNCLRYDLWILLDTIGTSKSFTLSVKPSHGLSTLIQPLDKYRHHRDTSIFKASYKSGGICSATKFIQHSTKKW